MIKYTNKTSILVFLFLAFISLQQCSSNNQVIIRTCYSTTNISDCSDLIADMMRSVNSSKSKFSLVNKPNSTNGYSNLVNLSNKKIDFAFVPYGLFQEEPEFEPYLEKTQLIQKVFFVPLLAVVSEDSPYYTLSDLKGKNIGIGVDHDNTASHKILQIFEKLDISYQAVEAKEIDFPALLDDKAIDMFLCLSVNCDNTIAKASEITGNLRFIPIHPVKGSNLEAINLDITPYKGVFLPENKKSIPTLGTWEYLMATKDVSQEKIDMITKALNDSLEKNSFTLSKAPSSSSVYH